MSSVWHTSHNAKYCPKFNIVKGAWPLHHGHCLINIINRGSHHHTNSHGGFAPMQPWCVIRRLSCLTPAHLTIWRQIWQTLRYTIRIPVEMSLGDSSALQISHTSSSSLLSYTKPFFLNNILCFPILEKNLSLFFNYAKLIMLQLPLLQLISRWETYKQGLLII